MSMNKPYIKPLVEWYQLHTSSLVCASGVDVNNDEAPIDPVYGQ